MTYSFEPNGIQRPKKTKQTSEYFNKISNKLSTKVQVIWITSLTKCHAKWTPPHKKVVLTGTSTREVIIIFLHFKTNINGTKYRLNCVPCPRSKWRKNPSPVSSWERSCCHVQKRKKKKKRNNNVIQIKKRKYSSIHEGNLAEGLIRRKLPWRLNIARELISVSSTKDSCQNIVLCILLMGSEQTTQKMAKKDLFFFVSAHNFLEYPERLKI